MKAPQSAHRSRLKLMRRAGRDWEELLKAPLLGRGAGPSSPLKTSPRKDWKGVPEVAGLANLEA